MNQRMMSSIKITLLLALTWLTPGALADWTLDAEASYLGFGSVKNDFIAENHHFGHLTGQVTAAGAASVVVDLASVETMIPIRNERMQQMLFKTEQFALATITSELNMPELISLTAGEQLTRTIEVAISLHGNELTKSIPVKVIRSSERTFDVTSLGPVFIHASQFSLSEGVEALRKIAGLQSIDLMVPVTVDLRFTAMESSVE